MERGRVVIYYPTRPPLIKGRSFLYSPLVSIEELMVIPLLTKEGLGEVMVIPLLGKEGQGEVILSILILSQDPKELIRDYKELHDLYISQ